MITVYEVTSGEIRSTLTIFDGASAALQCQEGESFIEGHFDAEIYQIKNGRPRMRRKRQRLAQAKRRAEIDLRIEAKRRLAASDWTQLPDAELSEAARSDWAEYRRAVRRIMKSKGDPSAPVWPAEPS